MSSPFDVFLDPEAQRINCARLAHLASLGLDLDRKRVLEVGAGIGLHTEFFEQRGCDVLSTDGSPSNVGEMLRRWPHRQVGLVDLDHPTDLRALGTFDIVYCYGTLYHLRNPDAALARLGAVCSGMVLVETIVSRGMHAELNPVPERPTANQAVSGIGCRPTRPWVMSALRRHFGHAYTTLDQPDYPDFVTDWSLIGHSGNLRAIFVGARQSLSLPTLTQALPIRHRNNQPHPRQAPVTRVWITVGAHHGEQSPAAQQFDPGLAVHVFDPLPALYGELADELPNYHVHAMAVGEEDGMAALRINSFDASSSLMPMDEATRAHRKDGRLQRDERVIQVPVTRLDSFMHQHAIRRVEFLKIDAQGDDLAVLRSAGDRLVDIDRIQLDVAATPTQLYQGAANTPAFLAYMAMHGFRLTETQLQSHDQEEKLTFMRTDAVAAQHELPSATVGHAGEHVNGLYDFAEAQAAHGELRQTGDMLEATTDPQRWAYTAVVPIGAAFRHGDTDRYQVELAVQVERGIVQVGILNQAQDDFPSAAIAAESPDWQTIILLTPPIDRAGPLVIRNAAETGLSHARCRLIAVTRVAAISPPLEGTETPWSLPEAEALAAQIQTSAQALAPMTATDSEIAVATAPAVVDAALRLRHALALGGQTLVSMQADAIAAIFAPLTSEQMAQLIAALATLKPLRPVPGWRMDGFLESGELATFIRYAIWLALRQRADTEPVILPWHAGTRLGLHLRNDLGMAVFVGGGFEPNEFALLDRVLQPGMTVLDGGANEGAYTLFLAARVGGQGRVMAVEPSPRELERLKANVVLNGMAQVTVVEAALAEQPGEVELLLAEPEHAGQNTLGGFIYPGLVTVGSLRVAATTIDALVKAQNLTTLDVVKLDLEGAELRALTGARETLPRWRPLLVFEAAQAALARQGGSLQDVLSLLADYGYKVLSFDLATGTPTPIGNGPLSDDLVAVHRERDWGLPA
jgi:FkbM family methyltransferase